MEKREFDENRERCSKIRNEISQKILKERKNPNAQQKIQIKIKFNN